MGFLIALYSSIPRYAIKFFMDEHALGIFAAIASLMVVTSTLMGALDQSAMARLARDFAGGRIKPFLNLLLKLCLIGAAVGSTASVIAWLKGADLLTLLYTREYGAYQHLFVWVMLTATIGHVGSSLRTALLATRAFDKQVPLSIGTTLLVLLGCILLIPRFGLVGGILAMMLGDFFKLVASACFLAGSLRFKQRVPLDEQCAV
jgi:O-antigen/teichoic acid export membrane protein